MSNEPGNSSINPMVTRLEGDAPEIEVSLDILKRGVYVAPVIIGVCAVFAGMDGAISALYGMVIVLVNFLLAAGLVAFTARISLGLMMGAVLFGYLVRLGSIFLAVILNLFSCDSCPRCLLDFTHGPRIDHYCYTPRTPRVGDALRCCITCISWIEAPQVISKFSTLLPLHPSQRNNRT